MSDDTDLLRQIAQGRRKAFEEFHEKYNRLVFRIALAILGDTPLAEEVTLDVFVRVWQRADTYHPERGKGSSWLVAITRHHAIDMLRRQRANPETNAVILEEITQTAKPEEHLEKQVEDSLQMKRVRQAFYELLPEQRQVLTLAYFKGYTHSQIAMLLNEPLGTVKTRIRTGMQKLRQILKDEE
jgi:RNA polymerase sigma-70 factor (ECF subfamily)